MAGIDFNCEPGISKFRESYEAAVQLRASSRPTRPDNLATRLRQPHIRRTVLVAVTLVVAGLLATQLHPDLRIGAKVVTGASETRLPPLRSIEANEPASLPPGDDWFAGWESPQELRRQILEDAQPTITRREGNPPAYTDSFSMYEQGVSPQLFDSILQNAGK